MFNGKRDVEYFFKVLMMFSTLLICQRLVWRRCEKEHTLFFLLFITLSCEFQANNIFFNKNLMEQKFSEIISWGILLFTFLKISYFSY